MLGAAPYNLTALRLFSFCIAATGRPQEQSTALVLMDTGPGYRNPAHREAWNKGREELAHSSREEIVLEHLCRAAEFYTLFPFVLASHAQRSNR